MKKTAAFGAVLLVVVGAFVAGRHTALSRPQSEPRATRRVLYYVDPMHPAYHSEKPGTAPDCGMALEPVYAEEVSSASTNGHGPQLPQGDIHIEDTVQALVGIRVAPVVKSGAAQVIRVVGRVVPEDTRVYRVNSGMEGFVRETYNDSVGVQVKKDQKLATYYGPDALPVASGFLSATERIPGAAARDGARTMPFPGALSKQGASSVQGYTDRLRNLGMSETQIKSMAESGQLPQGIDVVAPADGFILARNISTGQHFDRSSEFYRIADLSEVWIQADIFGSEAAQGFRPGAIARVTLAGQGKTFTARVSNVLPQIDPQTRTLNLRLVAENPSFALRPDMYVDVELPVAAPAGLTVPQDAVIDSGREQRVFVERSSGVFEPRRVETGRRFGDRVEIVNGLAEGERVVAAGTFLVDSESRLKTAAQTSPKKLPQENVQPHSSNEPSAAAAAGKVKDAACGMMIDEAKAVEEGNTITRDGLTYYFCSDRCKKKFGAQPEHYLASNPSVVSHD